MPHIADRPWTFRQLFCGGERQTLARYPNVDPDDPHGGRWAHVAAVEGEENHTEFFYGSDESHAWDHPEDGQVAIFGGYDWAFRIVPLAGYVAEERKIVLGDRSWGPLRIGDRYFIEGLFEELDAPGEWYLDPRTETVYFWPPDPKRINEVTAPLAETVVRMDNTAHVAVQGFVIEVCGGDAVQVMRSHDCIIGGNVIRHCGANAIVIKESERCIARGNDISDCGHGGIALAGGDRVTLQPGNNVADNNYIHHCSRIWKTYRPAVYVQGVGNRVSHNLIHDMPHAGILLNGNDHQVEYNIVHHVNLESSDTGGFYFCSRDWTQRGNVIRYNIFYECGGFGKTNSWAPVQEGKVEFRYPHFTWGIYLDDPTTGTHVYGNILYRVPICALHNHGGRDNTWENNILFDCPAMQEGALSPQWSEWESVYKKLHEARYPGSPYLERYPELASYADTRPEEMSGVHFLRNIACYTIEGTRILREATGHFPYWLGYGAEAWGGVNRQLLYAIHMYKEDAQSNTWDYNCFYVEPGLELCVKLQLTPEPQQLITFEEWQRLGYDTHSLLADPLFEDRDSFRLRADSPAIKLGFKPIPVDEIGLYEDASRASWPVQEVPGAAARGSFTTVRYYELPDGK